jgi:glycosyl transferase family 1
MADSSLIVLFKGHSQYDSVNTMVDALAVAFARRGIGTQILDTRAADCVAAATALVRQGRVRLFLSLNGFGIPAVGQGAGFYAESAAPVLIYFVDHPAYHLGRIRAPLPRLIATFPTAHQVEFCRRFIRSDLPLHHLPHASDAAAPAPWQGREGTLLLSASLIADPEPFRARWAEHGAEVAARLNAMVEAHDAAPTAPLHEIALAVLGAAAPPVEVLASYMTTVDAYLRSRIKLALAQALAHLPMLVCGEGWQRLASGETRASFRPAMPVSEVIAEMRRTKIVLNPLPPYYESHERPLQAMANGAVAANGPSGFLEGVFPDGFFRLPAAPRAAAAVIEAALADDAALEAIAMRGHEACLTGHLWDHRAAEMLRIAGV